MQSVIALARVSSEEQASEGLGGLERQYRDIDLIARRENLNVVKRYVLEGISGTTAHLSPQFKQMLTSIAGKDIVGLVISSADRLMRCDEMSSLAVLSPFDSAKSPRLIYTIDATYDLRKFDSKLLFMMRTLMAGNEKSQILARTQAGKAISRERGDKCADKPPLGVEFVITDNKNRTGYYRYTAESSRIKQAFARVLAEDSSLRSIAAELGFNGYQTMRKQLINPIWIGYREHTHTRERIPTADHRVKHKRIPIPKEQIQRVKINLQPDKPLIDIATFDRVQAILEKTNKIQIHKRKAKDVYLLSGVLFCQCGARYYSKHDDRRGKHGYYICKSGYHDKSKSCGAANLKRDDIEASVLDMVSYALCDSHVLSSLVAAALAPTNSADLKQDSIRLRAEVETLTNRRNKLVEKISDGILTDDEAKTAMAKVRAALDKASTALAETNERLKGVELPDADSHVKMLAKTFSSLPALSPEKQKEIIRQHVGVISIREGQISRIALKIRRIESDTLPVRVLSLADTGSWRRPA